MDSDGKPVQNAVVEVSGRRNLCPFSSDRNGEYFRLLLPGTYTITVRYRPRVVDLNLIFLKALQISHNTILSLQKQEKLHIWKRMGSSNIQFEM